MIAKVHDIALDKNLWNLKGSTEIAILLIAEKVKDYARLSQNDRTSRQKPGRE